jgi:tRNA nucleotidyltransferase/poly(A) polymerase
MLNFVLMKIKRYGQFVNENKISVEIPLPNDIIEISNAYIKAGKDIFLVGGAVRDFVKEVNPKDYDLVTNALPNESKEILKDFKVSDEQGKNFGVLRVYTKDEPEGYEVASYRRDISGGRDTKGDDQKVEMGGDVTIEDDCNRRDLTMNALFYDIKNKQIVDLVGGVEDIKKGIVRAVGNASQRFIEDRLRILRIFRFAARTGGKIDDKTSEAIIKDNRLRNIGPKDDVSQERIWEEMKKAAKQAKNYSEYLNFFNEFDMWSEVFPGAVINTKIEESDSFISYIANLFKFDNISDLEKRMVIEYKIEYDIASKVVFLINLLKLIPESAFDLYKQKIKCHCSTDLIVGWLDLNRIHKKIFIRFIDYVPSVSAEELMKQGFKGKALGDEIKRLEIEKFNELIQ